MRPSRPGRLLAATRPVELTAAVAQRAGQLARSHALRGADAIYLASALAIADPDLVVAVWDRRLHAGAQAAGLRVAPAQLGTAQPRTIILDGRQLRHLRTQRGLSQEELAGQAGVSVTTVGRLERQLSAPCRRRALGRLARALGEHPATTTLRPPGE